MQFLRSLLEANSSDAVGEWLGQHAGKAFDRSLPLSKRKDLKFEDGKWVVQQVALGGPMTGQFRVLISAGDAGQEAPQAWDAPGANIVWPEKSGVWLDGFKFDSLGQFPDGATCTELEFEHCDISIDVVVDLCLKWQVESLFLNGCYLKSGNVIRFLDVPSLTEVKYESYIGDEQEVFDLLAKHVKDKDHLQLQSDLIDHDLEEWT